MEERAITVYDVDLEKRRRVPEGTGVGGAIGGAVGAAGRIVLGVLADTEPERQSIIEVLQRHGGNTVPEREES